MNTNSQFVWKRMEKMKLEGWSDFHYHIGGTTLVISAKDPFGERRETGSVISTYSALIWMECQFMIDIHRELCQVFGPSIKFKDTGFLIQFFLAAKERWGLRADKSVLLKHPIAPKGAGERPPAVPIAQD